MEGADHAADDGSSDGFHHFGAGAGAPHNGEKAGDDGANGHDFGPEPQHGAIEDGGLEVGSIESGSSLGAFFGESFFEVNDHDDTRLDGGAEEGDVANPYGDTEIIAEEILKQNATCESEGNG